MNYPTDIPVLLLPARCATGTNVPVDAGVSNETGDSAATVSNETVGPVEPAIYCAMCDDELDEPDVLCCSCAEALADVAHGERVAELERELAQAKADLEQKTRALYDTQQALIKSRHTILDQARKIQRLLPANPPDPIPESNVVRFLTLRPTDTLTRLAGQQIVEDLLTHGWQLHSMTALPVEPAAVVVALTNPAKLQSPPRPRQVERPAFVPRRRPVRRAGTVPPVVAHVSDPLVFDARDTMSYAEALRAPRGTFTDAELAAIADREVHAAALRAFEGAADPALTDALTRLQTRRSSDAAQQ